MINYNPIVVIPHYNHSGTITRVAEHLIGLGLPVLIVDDGSDKSHLDVLKQLEEKANLRIIYRLQNGGKGMAVKQGMQDAFQHGFTHAVQVDADGQHRLDDVSEMLQKSQQNPTALVCGRPVYGDDAPKSRLYGRKITNFWIAVNTCSMDIADGMCGFRLYPLESIVKLLKQEYIGDRMDFDVELLVHCYWRKIPIIWVDTPVNYIQNGVSHFRVWADNWSISKMHARLFFKMLWYRLTGKNK